MMVYDAKWSLKDGFITGSNVVAGGWEGRVEV